MSWEACPSIGKTKIEIETETDREKGADVIPCLFVFSKEGKKRLGWA